MALLHFGRCYGVDLKSQYVSSVYRSGIPRSCSAPKIRSDALADAGLAVIVAESFKRWIVQPGLSSLCFLSAASASFRRPSSARATAAFR